MIKKLLLLVRSLFSFHEKFTVSALSYKLLLLIILANLSVNTVHGQIWSNGIAGNTTTSPYTAGQTSSAGITVSGIVAGSGLNVRSVAGSYSARNWTTGNSIDPNNYFEFGLTPNAGQEIDFLSFVYSSSVSAGTGWTIVLRSSVDNYTSNIVTSIPATGATISLSSTSFQNVTSTIKFRLYAYSSGNTNNVFNINDFQFNGTISCNSNISASGATMCVGGSGTISYGQGNSVISGTTITGSWNIATDPLAYRPGGETSGPFNNTASCLFVSSEAKRSYVATTFQVSVSGNYSFKMTDNAAYDGIAYIYSGNFTPGDCSGGAGTFIKGDDDDGVTGTEPRMTNVPLVAGTTYTLISTQYDLPAINSTFVWTMYSPPSGGALVTPGWYTSPTSLTPISYSSPFNPVGVTGSGLNNTNTAGTTKFYAAYPSSPCRTEVNFVINPLPTINGTLSVCVGSTTQLTGSTTAALTTPWTSATTGVATVNNAGLVSGVSPGTSVITYKNSDGCSQTVTVTVYEVPTTATISGTTTVCLNASSPIITLTNPQTFPVTVTYNINGGSNAAINIAASSTSNITIPTSTSGVFVYNLVSVANQLATTCSNTLSASATITVNSTPTITLNKADETCASSNNGTITPALLGGLTNIRYIKLTQKYVNADAYQQVAEIEAFEIFTGTNVARSSNGATAVASTTYSSLYPAASAIDGINSGNNNFWHSSSPNVNEYILVDLQSGKNIDYLKIYNRTDCCGTRGQNMLLELFDTSNKLLYSKTVDLFQSNTVTNVTVNVLDVSWADNATTLNRTGLDNGTYTLNYSDVAGCSTNPQANIGTTNPDAAITSVTGPGSVCIGGATTAYTANGVVLGGGTGAWSSTSPLIATVDASGNVTGVAAGTTNIVYTITGGCSGIKSALKTITVNSNAAITSVTGPGSVCIGGATTAYTANGVVLGGGTGAWSSTSPLIATVDASGNVTGVAAGTTDIVYTITGGCSGIKSALKTVTVNSNAAITSVTGPGSVCIGGATTAYTANGVILGGGTGAWSSTSPLIATVDASGNVTGVAAGTTNIVYTITGGCSGIKSAQINVTVNANLSPIAISPAGSQSLCATNSGTLLTVSEAGGGTITRQWGKRSTTGGTITNIPGATGTTYTPTGVDLGVGNWLVVCTSTPTCGTARVSNEVAVTVNANINASVTIAAVPSGAICSGTSVTFTATAVNPGTAPTYQWYKGSAPISLATGSTYTTTTLGNLDAISVQMISNATPCLTGSPATSNLITMTVNPTPTAPTASVTTQPTCAAPTGTITVSSPAEGTGFTYSINGTDYFPTAVFNNVLPSSTPYSVTTTNSSGCISPATLVTVNTPSGKVWNGSQNSDWTNALNWTPAVVPVLSDCVIVPSTVTKPEIASGASVTVHSITVSSGGLLTVRSKASLTVVTSVNVATGGDLVFEDDSSLLQTSTDNTINTGNITYNRISAPVRRYDFTFWSSPVTRTPTAYTLSDVSPLTLFDKYYSYSPTTGWVISYSGILPMTPGLGYIIRAPQTYDITNAVVYPATFVGKPNNGTIEVTGAITSKSILLGNPYPSGLNAIKFINYNHALGTDVGTLYFWTHNSPPSNTVLGDAKYNYTTADYAAFNLTGTVGTKAGTDTSNNIPTGIIAAGQAFFIRATSSGIITFTNDMRVGPGNDQFFKLEKANNEDKNRIWLNLSNNEGAFKQTLIGYLDGATNNWDINYDGTTLSGNSYVDFYSINDAKKLTVQGRAMPFDNTDLVPLGYVSSIAGDFTIAIDHGDGFFDTQAVYLEDKTTGKTVDLRAGNYTFTTAIGTFTDRFVLSYTNKTLGTGDFEKLENGLLVAVKEKTIKITSAKEAIKEVTIYDVNGKLLYNKKKIASTDLQVSNLQAANQVLLVKVILENEFTTTRKIIFQ
jgi:hypothetical protein